MDTTCSTGSMGARSVPIPGENAPVSFTVVNPALAHPQGQWLDLVLTALAQPIPVGENQPPLRGRRAQPNSGVRRERPGDPFPWGEI